jgi:hypothetical protein
LSKLPALSKMTDIKLRIRTREQRYIVEDVTPLEQLLRGHGPPLEYVPGRPETEITTVYFDTPKGTWSQGRSQTKLRTRSYQEPQQWWFELKRREGTCVDKWRRPMDVDAVHATLTGVRRWRPVARRIGGEPLQPLFGVRCRRTAFEWSGLRVTLDRTVTFFAVDPTVPLQLAQPVGWVAGVVVEVKHEGENPDWLRSALDGRDARNHSKSRYALALRDGVERPFLVAVAGSAPISDSGHPGLIAS